MHYETHFFTELTFYVSRYLKEQNSCLNFERKLVFSSHIYVAKIVTFVQRTIAVLYFSQQFIKGSFSHLFRQVEGPFNEFHNNDGGSCGGFGVPRGEEHNKPL